MRMWRFVLVMAVGSPMVETMTFQAQAADFQNLDFEQAFGGNPPDPYTYGFSAPISVALPSWTCGFNGLSVDYVLYNTMILDAPGAAVFSHTTPEEDWTARWIIGGKSSVVLQSTFDSSVSPPSAQNVSISQTGMVPSNARSVRFLAEASLGYYTPSLSDLQFLVSNNLIAVSLNGHSEPVHVVSANGGVMELGTDVSSFAGQTALLKLEVLLLNPQSGDEFTPGNYNTVVIDDIQFSPLLAPEPSPLIFLGSVAMCALTYAWLRRKRTA
jgi:hypothetical protein